MPKIEEYDASGKVVLRGWFGAKTGNSSTATYDWTSYRAYRREWVGRPRSLPAVKVCSGKGDKRGMVDVYMSWNGATDVKGWKIWAGTRARSGLGMRVLDQVFKNGFETKAVVDINSGDAVMVEAVGGVGNGTKSKIARVQPC